MSQSAQERTEQPTKPPAPGRAPEGPGRAQPKEAGQAASLVAATVALAWIGDGVLSRLGHALAAGIGRMGALARTPLDQAQVATLAVDAVTTVA